MTFDHHSEASKNLWSLQVDSAAVDAVFPSVAGIARINGLTTFSGLFVRIAGRRLVATAAHCLERLDDDRRLFVFSRQSRAAGRPFIVTDFWVDELSDVAVLSLGLQDSDSLRAAWLNLDPARNIDYRPRTTTYQVGFPAFRNESHDMGGWHLNEMKPSSYLSELTIRQPPLLTDSQSRPVTDLDMFIEISVDRTIDPQTNTAMDRFEPGGMSGAGVFSVQKLVPGRLWSPGFELIGIQCGHFRNSGLLRATKIRALEGFVQ